VFELRGRGFEPADRHRNLAVISARLATSFFPGQDPLGHNCQQRISHWRCAHRACRGRHLHE
jgi:hypothetical protein